jgi:hypothetical protein
VGQLGVEKERVYWQECQEGWMEILQECRAVLLMLCVNNGGGGGQRSDSALLS